MTYIYDRINDSQFIDAFYKAGRKDNFSYEALYKYLENLAEDTCEPIELDVVALCCEFTEYDSDFEDWESLQDATIVINNDNGGAIVQNY